MTAAEIAMTLGGAKKVGSQWLCRCPAHPDRTPSLALRDGNDGRVLLYCHAGCSARDISSELTKRGLLAGSRPPRPRTSVGPSNNRDGGADVRRRIKLAAHIWNESNCARDSIVEIYLRTRGLGLPEDATCLRYHPSCPRGSDRLPAMVAEMRSATTNEFLGVHRTFIKANGTGKADVDPQRMALGCLVGAVVKISADEDVTLGIGICEGIEDAIAIVNGGWRPVWCCVSAGNMSAFKPLPGIEAVTVFADADAPGLKAAQSVARHWRDAGREARIVVPKRAKDFGEALR
jgi:putative DNA primase/helicase